MYFYHSSSCRNSKESFYRSSNTSFVHVLCNKSFGSVVSEEKIFSLISVNQNELRIVHGGHDFFARSI